MNIGNINTDSKVVLYMTYMNNSNPSDLQNISLEVNTDSNLDSLQALYNIYTSGQQGNIFQQALAEQLYNNLSQSEKDLINRIKKGEVSLVSSSVSLEDNSVMSEDSYSMSKGVPTNGYLADLKASEELDFKNRDLEKFRKKMQKISGNQPLDELVFDVQGTSLRLSNIHVTNLEKLDRDRIKSPAFE